MTNDTNNKLPARLSDQERKEMLREFMLHVDGHPVQTPKGIVRSPYLTFLKHSVVYSLGIFFILGGTVYAAEGSLPEDPLYSLKTGVIEPIVIQLAPLVGVDKGDARIAIVERRLEEAETLLDQGELSTTSATILAAKITQTSSEIRRLTSDTAEDGNVTDALDTSSDLETLLEGHEEVLSAAAEDLASSSPTLEGLVDVVETQGDQTEDVSEDIEQQLTEATSTEATDYTSELMDAASSTIARLQANLADFSPADEDVQKQAAALLDQANAYYQSGLERMAKKDGDGALSDWREAQSAAEKGLIVIDSYQDPSEL